MVSAPSTDPTSNLPSRGRVTKTSAASRLTRPTLEATLAPYLTPATTPPPSLCDVRSRIDGRNCNASLTSPLYHRDAPLSPPPRLWLIKPIATDVLLAAVVRASI